MKIAQANVKRPTPTTAAIGHLPQHLMVAKLIGLIVVLNVKQHIRTTAIIVRRLIPLTAAKLTGQIALPNVKLPHRRLAMLPPKWQLPMPKSLIQLKIIGTIP